MSSLIDIFDFPDDADPSIVYLENDTELTEVTKADEFARTRRPSPASATPR